MDLQSYNDLLAAKGDDPHRIPDGTEHGDTHGYMAFRNDLQHGRVVWHNDKRKDCCAYLKLHHPLLSVCCAPKEHPFSRKERFTVLIVSSALAAGMSLVATLIGKGESDQMALMAGVSAGFGIVKAMLGKMMRYMMICPLCEKETCWSCCRCFWGCVGHFIMFIWMLVVFAILAGVIALVTSGNQDASFIWLFFFNFGVNKFTGWLWKLFWLSYCKFPCQWKLEKSKPEHKLDKALSEKGKYHVTFRDLPNYDASEEEDNKKQGGMLGTAIKVANKAQQIEDKLEGNGDNDGDDDNGDTTEKHHLIEFKKKTGLDTKHDQIIDENDTGAMETAPETKVDKKKKKKKRKKDKYPDA